VQALREDGELGEELLQSRVTKDGLVREMEIGILVRPETAEVLIKFLQEKVGQINKLKEQQKAKPEQEPTQ
jgi:hypothetical protein